MKTIFRIFLLLTALAVASFAQLGQKTSSQNETHDRGQTPVQPPGQSFDYGRVGSQASVSSGPVTLHGMLVDASCLNRTNSNLARLPAAMPNLLPPKSVTQAPSTGNSTAEGITVDAATLARERADIMAHQVPDILSRQDNPTCAITASTKEYGLVLPGGRFLDLDYGGDTLANELVFASPQGQGMLNGTGSGVKLPVIVTGRVFGDKFVVEQLTR